MDFYNEFNCVNTQVSRVFSFKAKLIITCKYGKYGKYGNGKTFAYIVQELSSK